jgi:hypothetical protein
MEQFIPIGQIIGWFVVIFLASYWINWLLARGILYRVYRLFVAPGVVVHELSHAVGCIITGSKITEINFWKADGGHVKHLVAHDPVRRLISDPIIALSPIFGTFLIIGFLTLELSPELLTYLKHNDYGALAVEFPWTSWQAWLYFYLVTSLMATVAPSKTDMKYALASLVVLLIFLGLVALNDEGQVALEFLVELLTPYARLSLVLLGLGLAIALLLYLPNRNKRFVARSSIE